MNKETGDPATWTWTAADKLFLKLVKEAHARGMKVILDGVFNHTGREFFAFKNLIEKQRDSSYKDWYDVITFDDPATLRTSSGRRTRGSLMERGEFERPRKRSHRGKRNFTIK